MNRRIFIGIDPGSKGACAVLSVADCPANEAQHGRVLAVEVFDLPVVARDSGGHDLDVVTFKVALRTALASVAGQSVWPPPDCDGLVEYPVLTAGFGGGVRQKVQQGVNAGAVWAATKSTGLVQVAWVDSDKWRTELGGVAKDGEALAVMALRATCPTHEGAMEFTSAVAADGQILNDTRPDRLVAVLLAEVARRRWLGTAVAPKTTGTARAAKERKADRRKEAIARAVAPLTVAKARVAAVTYDVPGKPPGLYDCPAHGMRDVCLPRNKCCEARLLEWAWRQRPDLPGHPVTSNVDPMRTLGGVVRSMSSIEWYMTKVTAVSKEWTVRTIATTAWVDGACRVPVEVSDALIDHGLVQLVADDKRVGYAPTARGLKWARVMGEPVGETST